MIKNKKTTNNKRIALNKKIVKVDNDKNDNRGNYDRTSPTDKFVQNSGVITDNEYEVKSEIN